MRRHHPLGGQRNDQEDGRDARMRRPGKRRGEDDCDDRLRRDGTHQHAQARHVLIRCDHAEEVLQRDEHQPEADRRSPQIARPRHEAAAKQNDPDEDEKKRDLRDVERQQLDNQGRADIRPEHNGERWNQINEPACRKARHHQPRSGAALQHRSDPEPGEKRLQPPAERPTEEAAQIRTESALDPALDHVHAPQQERDRAGEIDQRQGGAHLRPSCLWPPPLAARNRDKLPPRRGVKTAAATIRTAIGRLVGEIGAGSAPSISPPGSGGLKRRGSCCAVLSGGPKWFASRPVCRSLRSRLRAQPRRPVRSGRRNRRPADWR